METGLAKVPSCEINPADGQGLTAAVYPNIFPFFIISSDIHTMANTTSTPKHTDPATKNNEEKNQVEVKDKPSGKTKKTQKN